MARGQPTSGTHLITFERVVSLGRFDGHTVTSPGAPATAETAGGARSEGRSRRRSSRGHVLPMVAGITMVIAGLVAVGYGLFGLVITNFITAHEQTNLSAQFADRQSMYVAGDFDYLNDPSGTAIDPLGDEEYDDDDDVPVLVVGDDELSGGVDIFGAIPEPLPTRGEALGRIVIPQIDVDWAVVSGVRTQDLRKGPGHMTGSPLPGQYGNSVISGHRTTYGGPFSRLDELEPGDRFTVETLIGVHTYEVVSSRIVAPNHTWVVRHREGAWLTLTTCHPKYSSQQRLIVFAKLVAGPNFDAVTDYHGDRYDPPEPPEGTSAVPVYVPPTTTTVPPPASVTVSTPPGTAAGDLLLAQVTATGGASATISPPGGWTLVRRDNVGEELAQAIFRRTASGGGSHTFHVSGGGSAAGGIVRVANVDPQNPLWGSRGSTGTGTSLGTSGLTTDGPGTMVAFFGIRANTGLSTPGGFTQQYTTASGGIRVLGAFRSVGTGATGGAGSGAGAGGPWIAQTVVVRSAPIPEETTTTSSTTTSSTTTSSTTTTTTVPQETTTTTAPQETTTTEATTTTTTGDEG